MLAGHLGAGLAAKAAAPRIGLATLFGAALLLDILLWLLVLARVEAAHIPPDFAARHYLLFDFPWSHGLPAALAWSVLAGALWAWRRGDGRMLALAPAMVAGAAFSHWLLDWLVHPPELPLWGEVRTGLDLADHQPWAMAVELIVTAAGLAVFLMRTKLGRARRTAIAALTLAVALLTVAGTFQDTPPPDMAIVAVTSLAAILVIVLLAALADRPESAKASRP